MEEPGRRKPTTGRVRHHLFEPRDSWKACRASRNRQMTQRQHALHRDQFDSREARLLPGQAVVAFPAGQSVRTRYRDSARARDTDPGLLTKRPTWALLHME